MPGESYDRTRHVLTDVTLDALIRRIAAHKRLLIEKGGFKNEQAFRALSGPDPKTKDQVSVWLRDELTKLREGEKRAGAAPMRRGKTLPRAEIADLAMTMLEACETAPGENLICLLQELLDVDRHRTALANKHVEGFEMAVYIEAQWALEDRQLGLRKLANLVSVGPSTISLWRNTKPYLDAIESAKQVLTLVHKERLEAIRSGEPHLTEPEAFRRAFRNYAFECANRKDPDQFYRHVESKLSVANDASALEEAWKEIEPIASTYLPPDQEALRAIYQKHLARLTS